jgi:hypothetical protein
MPYLATIKTLEESREFLLRIVGESLGPVFRESGLLMAKLFIGDSRDEGLG